MNRSRWLPILILLSGWALAACGDDDDGDEDRLPPSTIVTIQPQPDATVVPGCTPDELEDWYEVAGTLVLTFSDESLSAVDRSPQEVSFLINRLIDLRNEIARKPTPECAILVRGEILLRLNSMLVGFQDYANGDIGQDELRTLIADANHEIETDVAALLEQTQIDLEERLRLQGAATATPSDQ